MSTKKIINDPVYGFISIPEGVIFDVIEHPFFQRLRRISQLGLTSYVYPGATHNRMCHAFGAFKLMQKAISSLRSKNIDITTEEEEGVLLGILLHDIGHGPFSHALEETIIPMHHEELSVEFIKSLNKEFDGKLELALSIFQDTYYKKFLHQLISSQLDVDRMDYLNRDSFFTGVHEGVIGYDRLLHMINVVDNELVIEEKGIFSIEKFLVARNLMYRQAYLHKTAIAAEQMLINALKRIKELYLEDKIVLKNKKLEYFLSLNNSSENSDIESILNYFSKLDDIDILALFKEYAENEDPTLAFLSSSILDRKIFKIELSSTIFDVTFLDEIRNKVKKKYGVDDTLIDLYYICGRIRINTYDKHNEEIKVMKKNREVIPYSKCINGASIHSSEFLHYVAYADC